MPVKIFLCYAREDEALLNKLKAHLQPLQRESLIDVWHDRDISAGTDWEQAIKEQLNAAQIILLLVSPDFMSSDYCYSIEMKRALERHERKEVRVIPIIVRPVYWQGILGNLQALPKDAKPVISSDWHSIDDALFNVEEGIRKVLRELNLSPISAQQGSTPTQHDRPQIKRRKAVLIPVFIACVVFAIIAGAFLQSDKILQSTNHTPPSKTKTLPLPQPLYQANWSQGMDGWVGGSQWTRSSNGTLASNGNAQNNNAIVAPYQPITANYAVEAHIQFLQPLSPSTSAFFGIFVRSGTNPDEVGYDCYMYDNSARIRKAAPLSGIILHREDYTLDTSLHIYRVEAKDSTITFFIDGKKVVQATDTTFKLPGHVGLFDSNSQINVHSFTVFPLL